MRLARHLLLKYDPSLPHAYGLALDQAALDGAPGPPVTIVQLIGNPVETLGEFDAFDQLFRQHDVYAEGPDKAADRSDKSDKSDRVGGSLEGSAAAAATAVVATVAAAEPEGAMPAPALLTIGATTDDSSVLPEQRQGWKKTTTVVLCDPRNLTHLVPKKMPERSLRVVKIMAKLATLQAALAEAEAASVSGARTDGDDGDAAGTGRVDPLLLPSSGAMDTDEYDHERQHERSEDDGEETAMDDLPALPSAPRRRHGRLEIRCLERDETMQIQDCFWEAVSLVHADEYIEYLRGRARDAAFQVRFHVSHRWTPTLTEPGAVC